MIKIATISSVPTERFDGQEGQFFLEVEVDPALMIRSGDPAGYIKNQIAQHLAKCVRFSGIPLHERAWKVEFEKWTQMHFHYPPTAVT